MGQICLHSLQEERSHSHTDLELPTSRTKSQSAAEATEWWFRILGNEYRQHSFVIFGHLYLQISVATGIKVTFKVIRKTTTITTTNFILWP